MNLFEAIPANLFSIFNSKNREIYVTTLFALRQSFKQELSIEKDKSSGNVSWIAYNLKRNQVLLRAKFSWPNYIKNADDKIYRYIYLSSAFLF